MLYLIDGLSIYAADLLDLPIFSGSAYLHILPAAAHISQGLGQLTESRNKHQDPG